MSDLKFQDAKSALQSYIASTIEEEPEESLERLTEIAEMAESSHNAIAEEFEIESKIHISYES